MFSTELHYYHPFCNTTATLNKVRGSNFKVVERALTDLAADISYYLGQGNVIAYAAILQDEEVCSTAIKFGWNADRLANRE